MQKLSFQYEVKTRCLGYQLKMWELEGGDKMIMMKTNN